LFHRSIASRQRICYNNQRADNELFKDSILIDIDFKQKIVIGESPEQKSTEYFLLKQRVFLGFGVYFLENNIIKCVNVDFIADTKTLSTDAYSVVRCFRLLRSENFFKKIDKLKYIIWVDCGPHFRCAEFCQYLFDELLELNINVNLNFFAEKHGKNSRDAHFSVVSRFLRDEKNDRSQKKIICTDDIIDCLNRRQDQSNINRMSLGLDPILFKIFKVIDSSKKQIKVIRKFLHIEDISCIYHITAEKNKNKAQPNKIIIKTGLLSDRKDFIEIKITKTETQDQYHKHQHEDTVEEDKEVSFNTLGDRRKFNEMRISNQKRLIDQRLNPRENKVIGIKPNYCTDSCKDCNIDALYKIEDINQIAKLGQAKIKEELSNHGHPMTRKQVRGKTYTLQEQKEELIAHYNYRHSNQ
jgi:hypothetical protein